MFSYNQVHNYGKLQSLGQLLVSRLFYVCPVFYGTAQMQLDAHCRMKKCGQNYKWVQGKVQVPVTFFTNPV